MSRAAALEVTKDEWVDMALGVIAMYAERRIPFTAEDVRRHLDEGPSHPNAWGRAFTVARRRGLIVSTGHTVSRTRSRKGGVVAIWIGAERKHRESH